MKETTGEATVPSCSFDLFYSNFCIPGNYIIALFTAASINTHTPANLNMRLCLSIAMSLAFTYMVRGSPLAANGPEDTTSKLSRATNTFINAPLTDWMKNVNTDLQWYTTIAVGTPPQNL